ncbi:MAG: nicotinate-nucleotide--dimethylbenzimidazole phosphoribosyltransferase [Shewanella psychromarinicola]
MLGLRFGEGTGAALALIQATLKFHNKMASLYGAGVNNAV